MAAIHQRGWCDGTGGNFSCVLEREPLEVLMAPSGVDKGRVRPQELIVVDGEGGVNRGSGRASAETLLHLAIVRETGAGAVLHTHSQAGTLLSQWSWEQHVTRAPQIDSSDPGQVDIGDGVAYLVVRNLEMLKGISGITTHQSEVRIPVLANDQDLQRLSGRALAHLNRAPAGLLIAGHGLYAWGQDLGEARRHLEILEFLMEQRWRQLLLESLVERGLGSVPAKVTQGG
jgi:methylthioribulose-1-phosphate dehydratase